MKRILAISVALFLSISGISICASETDNEVDSQIDDRFIFSTDDFDPTTAFINIDDEIDVSLTDVDVADLIAYAKEYLGRPYASGSKGPRAFDCSGFTSFVFRNFDIRLNPSSSAQASQGTAVSRTDIRPGDLLFFKGRRSSGVGHVAIAIDVDPSGEVSFIHAATSKGIRIDRLNADPYYRSRYVCARRVIE